MANMYLTLRVMPENAEVNLDALTEKINTAVISCEGKIVKTEQEPVAFGLKALKMIIVCDESKSSDEFENAIKELEREIKGREFKKNYATSALFRLKKKYPAHFLLFPSPTSNKNIK